MTEETFHSKKGRGIRLTDTQRLEILTIVENNRNSNTKLSTKKLAEEYGITQAAILKLIKNREKYISRIATGRQDIRGNRKRGGHTSNIQFENELYQWISNNSNLSPSMIQQEALKISKKYKKMEKFQASWGWYYRFCNRFHVSTMNTPLIPREMPIFDAKNPFKQSQPSLERTYSSGDANNLVDAAKAGDIGLIQTILESGVPIDRIDHTGCTALVGATKEGHLNIVKFLLENGAKPDATDQNGSTVLILAVKMGFFQIVKLCLESYCKIEATDSNLKTPLILAAENGDLNCVKILLKFGASLEATDQDDASPLYLAVKNGHTEIVDFLIKKGAKHDTRHIDGLTPLEMAAALGHTNMVKFMI